MQVPELRSKNPGVASLLLGSFGFPMGLFMIVVVGADLFTSNCSYMLVALFEGRCKLTTLVQVRHSRGPLGLISFLPGGWAPPCATFPPTVRARACGPLWVQQGVRRMGSGSCAVGQGWDSGRPAQQLEACASSTESAKWPLPALAELDRVLVVQPGRRHHHGLHRGCCRHL